MNKRFAILTVLALAMTAALGFTASAQESITGTGTLTAQGDGRAVVKGTGTVAVSGNGVLKIFDCGGDAVIEVTGAGLKTMRQHGDCIQHKYTGFNGSATVSGTRIKVIVRGAGIDLTAMGTGIVYLKGKGTFVIGDREGRWTLDGRRIVLSQ